MVLKLVVTSKSIVCMKRKGREEPKKKKKEQKRSFKPNIFLFKEVGMRDPTLCFKTSKVVLKSYKIQPMNKTPGPLGTANV